MTKKTTGTEQAILLLSSHLGRGCEPSSIRIEDEQVSFEITDLVIADHFSVTPVNNLLYAVNSYRSAAENQYPVPLLVSEDIFINPVYKSYRMIIRKMKELAEISLDFVRLRSKSKNHKSYEIVKGKEAVDLLNGVSRDSKNFEHSSY